MKLLRPLGMIRASELELYAAIRKKEHLIPFDYAGARQCFFVTERLMFTDDEVADQTYQDFMVMYAEE